METNFKHIFHFNAFQIKTIALITMTLDHVGAYQTLSFDQTFNEWLRIIGRIAAPLFLFMVVESLHHTHNKAKYILRLYSAGVIIEFLNRIIEKATGTKGFGNTLPMLFYTSLFIFYIEYIINNRKNIRRTCIAGCGLVIPLLFYVLNVILPRYGLSEIWYAISLFFPSPFKVDYSVLFILMGISWYFINNKAIDCIMLAILSLLCFLVPANCFFVIPSVWFAPAVFNIFELFVDTQWCMCLAIPFIFFYNGEKGHSLKYLFYIYYPVHVYFLFFIAYIRDF